MIQGEEKHSKNLDAPRREKVTFEIYVTIAEKASQFGERLSRTVPDGV